KQQRLNRANSWARNNPARDAASSVRSAVKSGPCVPKEELFLFASRSVTARLVVGIFFPQRPVLKLDEHGYSPTTMYHILYATAEVKAHNKAATLLDGVDDLPITGTQVNGRAGADGRRAGAGR